MSHAALQNGRQAFDAEALEASAKRAGLALACAYSSSDEYEADVIRMRRAAGAYGPRHHRQAIVGFAALAVAFIVALFAL